MHTSRLEAIMFTDIAGYSRLMDEDEDRTIRLLKRHNEIVLPVIEADSGQVVDAIGDGLFVTFPSVRRAVECAVTIHERINSHNSEAPEEEQFRLRIGVHIGEIRHEEGRVFGTGVNVAARVQPFAQPGGICITEDVFRQVERRIPQPISSIGTQKLRHISRPYVLYRVQTGYEIAQREEKTEVQSAGAPGAPEAPAPPAVAAKRSGELDEVKEKILSEIGKWSERSQNRDPNSTEARMESKVYGVVEKIMDKALEKWESMPEEKKSNIIHKINVEIDKDSKKKKEKESEKPSSIAGSIVWGTVAAGASIFWYTQVPGAWPIILGITAGLFPLMSGFTNLIKRSIKRRDRAAKKVITDSKALEGVVLKAAKELGGRVTVVQIAAHTGQPLDEVQTALEQMAQRGYVSLEVLETGVVRYDFPSLLPENTDSKPIG